MVGRCCHCHVRKTVGTCGDNGMGCLLLDNSGTLRDCGRPVAVHGSLVTTNISPSSVILSCTNFHALSSVIHAHGIFSAGSFVVVARHFRYRQTLFVTLRVKVRTRYCTMPSPGSVLSMHVHRFTTHFNTLTSLCVFGHRPHFLKPLIPVPTVRRMPRSTRKCPTIAPRRLLRLRGGRKG